ncbi:hypothetical protein pdam_00021333 [Pocillopora damicornis]|uniref:Uncharacterized protein n=1 Tax=Pocillopora damicornis TaxID=46731 RepID=A0A3M6UG23_POCDA|nr:hypothetical protein pdam_00021333 [Pocillopora damicornis]
MFYLRFFSRFGHPENFSVNHGCCSGNRFQIERIAQPRIMETFERDRNCIVANFTDVYVAAILHHVVLFLLLQHNSWNFLCFYANSKGHAFKSDFHLTYRSNITDAGFQAWDKAFVAYLGFVTVLVAHRHPVMLVFCQLLIDRQKDHQLLQERFSREPRQSRMFQKAVNSGSWP